MSRSAILIKAGLENYIFCQLRPANPDWTVGIPLTVERVIDSTNKPIHSWMYTRHVSIDCWRQLDFNSRAAVRLGRRPSQAVQPLLDILRLWSMHENTLLTKSSSITHTEPVRRISESTAALYDTLVSGRLAWNHCWTSYVCSTPQLITFFTRNIISPNR